jgi:hypothetical protein
MTIEANDLAPSTPWTIDDIPYHRTARERVRENRLLFYTVASAAFVEITSDVYTRNLVEYFRGDDESVGWLLKPLDLAAPLSRIVIPTTTAATRLLFRL